MKNSNIKNINKAGKIGYIISIFLIIGSILAIVAVGICAAMTSSILTDDVNVKINTNINVNSKGNILNKLNKFVVIGGVKNLSTLIENSDSVKINDNDISDISIVETENGPAKVLSCDVINRNLKVKYQNEENSFGYLKLPYFRD